MRAQDEWVGLAAHTKIHSRVGINAFRARSKSIRALRFGQDRSQGASAFKTQTSVSDLYGMRMNNLNQIQESNGVNH